MCFFSRKNRRPYDQSRRFYCGNLLGLVEVVELLGLLGTLDGFAHDLEIHVILRKLLGGDIDLFFTLDRLDEPIDPAHLFLIDLKLRTKRV